MMVRTRFAPSPTGYLHVGGARTALYNWLYAKAKGGKFILRIEDTDQARSTEESLQLMTQDLKWLGLLWDEGPEVNGPHAPYKQSQRQNIYQEHGQKILKEGRAYYCFCSDEMLEQKKQKAMAEGRPPQYDGTCRNVSLEDAKKRMAAGEKAVVRFKVAEVKDYIHQDFIRGEVVFPSNMVGDFVCLRSDGMPVYNFCCVVDDALMGITHVLRAEEHLSNTLRQMMLYQAFGYELPKFGHLSLILGPDKQKLSKRHGAASCDDFRRRGFLPEAMINYLSLLGWSSPKGDELMSVAQIIEQFELDRFTPSPAVFDEVKLKWMNSVYLRGLEHKDLWKRVEPFLMEAGVKTSAGVFAEEKWRDRALTTFKTSMELLVDAVPLFKLIDDSNFKMMDDAKEVLSWETSLGVFKAWLNNLEKFNADFLTTEDFEAIQNKVKEESAVKGKNLFMPIRVCVIGQPHGTELKMLVPLIPKSSLILRAKKVLGV